MALNTGWALYNAATSAPRDKDGTYDDWARELQAVVRKSD